MKTSRLFVFAILLIVASQAVGWPLSSTQIVPQNPTSSDLVAITLGGDWGSSCTPNASAISVMGDNIYFDVIWDYPPDIICLAVMTPWQLTESIGPLATGTYTVYARIVGHPGAPVYEPVAEFIVTAVSYYVDAIEGNDLNDGLTPETAFATIQKGIDTALDGDTIIAADGTYTGPGNRDIDFEGKAITLRGENGPQTCIIDCENASGHRGFYLHSGEDANSIVSGFTITNGHIYDDNGGGIYCSGSSPTIENCIISNNNAIGASGIDFGMDGENGYGGAIFCTSDSNAHIINCTIISNAAMGGNGFMGGGGGNAYGGSIYGSNLILENCIISDNVALGGDGTGGALGAGNGGDGYGAAIFCSTNGAMTITNCAISNNEATGGNGGDSGSYFAGVGGSAYGGAIYCDYNNTSIIGNCIISENMASGGDGGTIIPFPFPFPPPYSGADGGDSHGGGICYWSNEQSIIKNCTISSNTVSGGNSGGDGGSDGDGYGAIYYSLDSRVNITNSIIWDEVFLEPEIALDSSASYSFLIISYSDVQGGQEQILSLGVHVFIWSINIDSDPCFADMNNGDYHLQSQIGRWDPNTQTWVTDANTSLCIDAGNSNSDWTAELWPHGKRINMGAFGGTAEASMSPSDAGNIADLNNDDSVDFQDHAYFANGWKKEQILLPEDLDRNGIVDFNDLQNFTDNWLWQQY